jgi:hypothetical protein
MARSKTRRVIVTLAAMTPLLAACNAILGISDFSKGECAGGGACDGTSSSSGGFDGGQDAPTDAPINVVDARGVDPVSWAQWKMPNYPTTADSGPNVNLENLKDNGVDEVQDLITGLTWRKVKAEEHTPLTWDNAKDFCTDKGAGYRLPTRIELVTLLNLDPEHGSVRANALLGLQSSPYWTTSLERTIDPQSSALRISTKHWVVNFDATQNGLPVIRLDELQTASVICVKGKS